MINRVDAQHSLLAPYDRAGRRAVHKEGDAPAFLLKQEGKGVVYEHNASEEAAREAARKKREDLQREKRFADRKQAATKEDASGKRQKDAEQEKTSGSAKSEAVKKEAPAPDVGAFLRKTLGRVRSFFAGIVRSIWYGDDPKTEEAGTSELIPGKSGKTIGADSTGTSGDADPEKYSDARIRELLAKKDEVGFMDALTQGHTRIPARSTSLLTYYDKWGRLVGPAPTDSARILKGDGGGRDTIRRPQGNYRRFI